MCNFLKNKTDYCVKCGLCLPHCPTYNLYQDEAESPRGRLALIQAILQETKKPDKIMLSHLNKCLLCRRCEKICPAGVHYEVIMDNMRQNFRCIPRWLPNLVTSNLFTSNNFLLGQIVSYIMRSIANNSITKLLPESLIKQLVILAKQVHIERHRLLSLYKPTTKYLLGRVVFFIGCLGNVVNNYSLNAAIMILNRIGFVVEILHNQGCCGAIHRHAGYKKKAINQERKITKQFSKNNYDAIVSITSSCAAYLKEFLDINIPIYEVSSFIGKYANSSYLAMNHISQRIAVHFPCTLETQQDWKKNQLNLLHLLPGAELYFLKGNGCCGGAGLHLLTQIHQGKLLALPLIEELQKSNAEVLITSNSGCYLHLKEQIKQSGLTVKIQYPLELLKTYLGKKDAKSK